MRLARGSVRVAACLIALLCAPAALAQLVYPSFVDPRLDWRSMDSAHFTLHFPSRQRKQAELVAAIAEQVWVRHTRRLGWEPRERTHIVLLDSADFSNGYATPLPFANAGIFLSPPDEGELMQNRA